MAIKQYKPTTPSRRTATVLDFQELTEAKPARSLVEPLRKRGGRNSAGRITTRHRGGGHKRRYRRIDFRREKTGVPAVVAGIEYDPNRTANIARLHYVDGEKRYIIAPHGLKVGDRVISGPDVEPTLGNALPLEKVRLGQFVHSIELTPGRGGCLARSAGCSAQLMSREGKYAQLKLASGEIRMVNVQCMATIGRVGNAEHSGLSEGKAGRKRWRGIRPTVRGVAMNPVDHPMGGGEGRSSGGGHPMSPWGKLSKGGKTRCRRKPSGKFIVKRRK